MKTFTSLSSALRAIKKDNQARMKRLDKARLAAGVSAAKHARQEVPRAFEELSDSIHVEDGDGSTQVIADAPHAAAVEWGSRPHTPPLEPLIRWVTLRGLQGLTAKGGVRSNRYTKSQWAEIVHGTDALDQRRTTVKNQKREAAYVVASALRKRLGREGAAAWRGSLGNELLSDDPAVVAIARAIQAKIAKQGTKPTHFMGKTVPFAASELRRLVREALPTP